MTVVHQAPSQVDIGGGSSPPSFKTRTETPVRSEPRSENRSEAKPEAKPDTRAGARVGARLGALSAEAATSPLVSSKGAVKRVAKRCIDVIFSAVGLLVTSPLMALMAILIRLDSPGPALFRQTRIGRDGRPFELVKLRTMYQGDGARATRLGCLLRPMGLDELPQLWNVLIADMSIVGPRPERPHLVTAYQSTLPGYGGRHAVRPGITGWAQIHGLRGGSGSIAERLRFDLEYVRTWNPIKDFRILALTVTAVWRDTRRELRI